ncbi:hypothetical protein [Streptomyces atriruber]|uniref:hypothetical protein n=1 Tax=Streptomyces atriruber TaxID=545121 RepID=UPI0007C759A8
MSHKDAVALVQRLLEADGTDEEAESRLEDALDRALGCPAGYVTDLIFWPAGRELSATEVVERALAYRPIALRGTGGPRPAEEQRAGARSRGSSAAPCPKHGL